MRCDSLHLTLAFLGNVESDRIALLREVAADIQAQGFTLPLDKLGCWRHIVWAGCEVTPEPLSALAGELSSSLRNAGFSLEDRPFAAHVTLLRNARCDLLGQAPPFLPALDWQVNEFVLAQSSAACYTCIGRWPLAPASECHDNGI